MYKPRKKSLQERMDLLDPDNEDNWWNLYDIETEMNRKNRLKLTKKYGKSIVNKVEEEFEHLRFWWGETITPPKKIFGRAPKLYRGEECWRLRYYSDCRTDIAGDGWFGDVFIKTKKGFFYIHIQD